jgi:hypothetical protein
MTDKQFSESYISIDPKNLKPAKIDRGAASPLIRGEVEQSETEGFEYKRYLNTDSGISPYSIP